MNPFNENFSEIECFDAFMELQSKHSRMSKPSELEKYLNDAKAFFRAIHDMGIEEGFLLGEASNGVFKKLKDE